MKDSRRDKLDFGPEAENTLPKATHIVLAAVGFGPRHSGFGVCMELLHLMALARNRGWHAVQGKSPWM